MCTSCLTGRHMYNFCFCVIASGNVIIIFLINDILRYPSALLIRMIIFLSAICLGNNPPLPQLKINALAHMQPHGVVDGTEDWDTTEAEGPLAKGQIPVPQ